MKNCSNCGKPLEDGAALCESRGFLARAKNPGV